MIRLFLILLGFVGGIIVGRNAEEMNRPEFGAIILCLFVACAIMWTIGYRGKNEAVATAVATAISQANARADAKAQAVANSAINLYLGHQAGVTPEILGSIVDQSIETNDANTIEYVGSTVIDHDKEKESA